MAQRAAWCRHHPNRHEALNKATWRKAKPLIAEALARGLPTHNVDDIRKAIVAGDMQLWCEGESVVVTHVEQYPRARVCLFALAAGRMKDVMHLKGVIESWARERGCDYCEIYGRRGWRRQCPDYDEGAVVLWRAL